MQPHAGRVAHDLEVERTRPFRVHDRPRRLGQRLAAARARQERPLAYRQRIRRSEGEPQRAGRLSAAGGRRLRL